MREKKATPAKSAQQTKPVAVSMCASCHMHSTIRDDCCVELARSWVLAPETPQGTHATWTPVWTYLLRLPQFKHTKPEATHSLA